MGASEGHQENGNFIAAVLMGICAVAISVLLAMAAPSKPAGKDPGAPADKSAATPAATAPPATSSAASSADSSSVPKTLTVSNATSVKAISDSLASSANSKSSGEQQASFNNPADKGSPAVARASETTPAKPAEPAGLKAAAPAAKAAEPAVKAADPAKTAKAAEPAKSADPAKSEYLPAGAGLATPVSFTITGGSTAPIQKVEYQISKPFKTPARATSTAKVEGLLITFGESNYDAKADKFSLNPSAPQVVFMPNQPVPMAVSIIWPKYAGWSYRGKLLITQAGQQPITLDNVEVDIVKTAAK